MRGDAWSGEERTRHVIKEDGTIKNPKTLPNNEDLQVTSRYFENV